MVLTVANYLVVTRLPSLVPTVPPILVLTSAGGAFDLASSFALAGLAAANLGQLARPERALLQCAPFVFPAGSSRVPP